MRFFPSGIAEGEAFCNRVEERKRLKQYIDNVQSTVIMAPRRYGKSSLITQVVAENNYLYVWVDFLSVTSKLEAEEKIRSAAKELLLLLSPDLKKLQVQAVDKLKAMSPELNLGAMGQTLTLHLSADTKMSIDDVLTELDVYAQKVQKKAVFVFDEFQQISELTESQSVEALVRHAVERSKAITYLFSGSSRHLLREMFSHKNRPLYRLCTMMQIDRIPEAEYVKFITRAAVLQWKISPSEQVILKILELTERHSFYVNALCNELWLNPKLPESVEFVEETWRTYMARNKSTIVAEVVSLPLNQKKLIKALSTSPECAPYGTQFLIKTGISSASIRRALEALLLNDMVFEDENSCYRVLDPAISYYFKCMH